MTDTARRIRMTLGKEDCDLAIVHVDVVDVFGCEVMEDSTVLVGDGVLLAVVPSSSLPSPRAREVVDGKGRCLLPGLFDAHVHIESTMLTPGQFAAAVLPFGTTRVVADPHEIANVGGTEGLRYMFDAARGLPVDIRFALPSCVPCTPFEDAGAVLGAADLRPFLRDPQAASLGEVMNCPGVLACDGDLLAKVDEARGAGLAVDGHCPGLRGLPLAAYAGCGVGNDHECTTLEGMRARLRAGLYVFIRQGSAARSLETLVPGVTPHNARRCCLCTDDMHAGDILGQGHINRILARAVALGLPAPVAVAMASLNPSLAYGLSRTGAVAPGWAADLCLVEDLVAFRVAAVWRGGRKVAEEGRVLADVPSVPVPARLLASVHVGDLAPGCFRLPLPGRRARVIGLQPRSLVTRQEVMDVATTPAGDFDAALNPGLCKVAVVERHRGLGLVGLGILSGYAKEGALLGGAIATSIAHDSHNIVVAGSSDGDMAAAVRRVCAMQGGIALVRDGQVVADLPLPVAGLMSTQDAAAVAEGNGRIARAARLLAVSGDVDPVVTLSFMALCVIPSLKVNTRGLFDVDAFRFVRIDDCPAR